MYASSASALAFSNFGDLLKFLRRRERLTQLELSIAVGYSEAQISRLEKNHRLPDLTALQALFIPALHLEKEPELVKRFLELAESARVEDAPAPGFAPYKGLHFFDESDAEWFFGREALTAHLVEHVQTLIAKREGRLLAVVGASGSGKSSVVRAGLAVALKRAGWNVCVMTPTAQPVKAFASTEENIQRAADHACVLLIVDQFEEVFTLCRDESARAAFIDKLLALANAPNRQSVVALALRADFYTHCAQYPQLRQAIAAQQEFIGQMSPDELRRAIEEPAQRGGWEFEPGLVELMLRDVGADSAHDQEPGALPLLSHALLATWEHRRGRTFTLRGYRASGGVRGAIAETAESVFTDQLNQQQQDMARGIFLRLTELGEGTEDTRRHATLTELVPRIEQAGQLRAVLNTLADARLVMLGEDSAQVAHEALIREWQRLRDWLSQDREGLRLHRQLTQAAHEWELLKRDAGALYRGARLAQAVEWSQTNADALNDQERAFLDASIEQEHREEIEREALRQRELQVAQKLAETQTRTAKQLRHRAYFLASAFVLAIGLAFIALFFGEQAHTSAVTAQTASRTAFARELSVNAISNLDVDPERSILLALQAVSVSTAGGQSVLRETEEALHRAVMTSRVRMTLRGHTGYVFDAAFSPDGKRIATASQDKTAKIWDAATGKELFTLTGHTNSVQKVAFSPDGKRLATGSRDKSAKIWDVATGKELMTLQDDQENWMVAFSPDGSRIATGCNNKIAKVWDISTALNTGTATGKLLFTFPCNPNGVSLIAFSPDGKRIAISDVELTAKVYEADTGKELFALVKPVMPNVGVSIAYSPDGKQIATATYEGQVTVWDAMSGQALLSWMTSRVFSVAFDRPFGTRLITGHNDGTIKVWDISSASTQGAGLLFTLAGHASTIRGLDVSSDGSRLVTASYDSTARIWDITDNGTSEWLTITDGACCNAIYTLDGKRLIGASRINTSLYGTNRMNVWDATTGQILRTFDTGQACGGDVSRDGKRYLQVGCGTSDNMAKVWDLDTGNQLFSALTANADDPNFAFYGAAFNPDGTRIATPTGKGNITIWDINSNKEVMTLSGHTSTVNALAYSPDGTLLASNADTVKIWNALSGKELRTLPTPGFGVTFSPDGTRLATANLDGTVTMWEVATWKALQTLRGHTSRVYSVAFSPDGNRLVTGSGDATIKVWNVSPGAKAGEQPLTLYGGSTAVSDAQFSPDGKRIAVGWSYRGTGASIRVFALDLNDIIAIAKSRVTRALTNDECQKYLHVDTCPEQP